MCDAHLQSIMCGCIINTLEYHEYKKSFEIKRIPKTPYTVKLNKNLHRGKQNMVKVFVVLYKL